MAGLKGIWKQLSSSGNVPIGRSSHSLNVINNKAYVFSGENTPRVPIDNDLMEYDLSKETWTKVLTKGERPCPRVAHGAVASGPNLFVFGGRTGIAMGENSLDDLFKYDPSSQSWEKVEAKGNIPQARSFHAMASAGSKAYMFGGCVTEGRKNDLHVFDVETSSWSQLPTNSDITGRGGPGLAVVDGSVYVISGFVGHEVNDMYQYNIETGQWKTIEALPNFSPRSVFGTAVLGKKIFVFGGEVAPSDQGHAGAGQFTNETFFFDTEAPEKGWRKVEVEGSLPSPRGWLQASAVSDKELLVFGGNSSANDRLNDIYLLKIE